MENLTDIGVNLCSKQYNKNHDTILEDSKNNNVTRIITITNSLKEIRPNLDFCKKYNSIPRVFCTIGVHPHSAKSLNDGNFNRLRSAINKNREHVIAVGECGLDYNRMFSPKDVQIKWFRAQIELALEVDLPLYLHSRDATEDFLNIVKDYDLAGKAIVHCFTGSRDTLLKYLDLGFYIGITGWVCDDYRGKELQKAVPLIPLDRLLLETDSPWLTPKNIRPRPRFNEPKYITYVVDKVAQLIGIQPQELVDRTNENRQKLFGF